MSLAFVDMNPFPLRQIQNRRTFHLEKVQKELTELEAIRQTFLRERETSQDGRTVISDDEDWIPANHQQHLCEIVTYLVFFGAPNSFWDKNIYRMMESPPSCGHQPI